MSDDLQQPCGADTTGTDRRTFLAGLCAGATGLAAGAAGLAGLSIDDASGAAKVKKPAGKTPPPPKFKTKRVVWVILGGGVRARDVFGPAVSAKHDDCPTLNTIAGDGILVRNFNVRDAGHYGSTMTLLTGVDQKPLKLDERTEDPTLFELLRKEKRLPGHEVWMTAAGADWHSQLSFSRSTAYGVRYGANYIAGDGVFISELADVTNQFGNPKVPGPAEQGVLDALRKGVEPGVAAKTVSLREEKTPADVRERVRRYVLDELSGSVRKIESPGLRDIMALHYATNLLAVYKPVLTTVACIYAAVAGENRDRYHQVLRKNDREIQRLWDTIQKDPELKATTTLVITPDFGRNSRENAKGGLDHDDKGKDHLATFLLAAGPDFKKGDQKTLAVDQCDVAPTLLHLLGVTHPQPAGKKSGRVATELFA